MGSLSHRPSRRSVLIAAAAATLGGALPGRFSRAGTAVTEKTLVAAPGRVALVGAPYPETDVSAYDGAVPGPEIRLRQGERLR
ncbi:MAG: hypothetical protein ACM3JG_04535, partial [Thiohalocapsa sp.]